MPFDPYLEKQFAFIQDIPSFEAALFDPAFAGRFAQWMSDPEPWVMPATVAAEDRSIEGQHGPIPVRLYRPADASPDAPALLWMHGGAFMFGDLNMNESHMVSAELAARAGAIVVAVDYRLAVNGVKYPVPLDDVVAAWRWLAQNANELGAHARRLFIGGASAGGNLAASASMRLRDEGDAVPQGMLLAYPLVHFPVPALEPETVLEMEALPPMLHFPVSFHETTMLAHLGRITDIPAGVAPGHFALEGMPAAWITIAEFDELRPSAELFGRQLESVGVPVESHFAAGFVHGFLDRTPSLGGVDRALDFFAGALRER